MVAVSTAAFVNGKAGEFFSVRPISRARRLLPFLTIAVVCIAAPEITRMLTVSTPDAASRRLQFVSFNRRGFSQSASECTKSFASSIKFHSGGPAFAFEVDLVAGQFKGKAVFHPGPQAIAAFRSAIKRGSVAITLQLAVTFFLGILIAFYSNVINVRGERRWDGWFTTALIVSGFGIDCEVFARDALPFPGMAAMTAFMLSAALLSSRLLKLRFALP